MKKYQALLIDINGTLFDYRGARNRALAHAVSNFWVGLTGETIEETVVNSHIDKIKHLERELKERKYPLEEIRIIRFGIWLDEAMNIKYGSNENERIAKELCQDYTQLTDDFIRLHSDVKPSLELLYEKGFILALASNGPSANQIRRLTKLDLYKYFSYSFFSEDMGTSKPDPSFYDHVFRAMAIKKEKCLAVGDNMIEDVSGALNYGCDAAWINRNKKIPENAPQGNYLTITSFHDLCIILGF